MLRVYVRRVTSVCVRSLFHSLSHSLVVPRATVSSQRAVSRLAVDDRTTRVERNTNVHSTEKGAHTSVRSRVRSLCLCVFLFLYFSLFSRSLLSLSHSLALSQLLPPFHSNSVSLTACRKESREVRSASSSLFLSFFLSPLVPPVLSAHSYKTKDFSAPLSSRRVTFTTRRVTTVARCLLLFCGTRTRYDVPQCRRRFRCVVGNVPSSSPPSPS